MGVGELFVAMVVGLSFLQSGGMSTTIKPFVSSMLQPCLLRGRVGGMVLLPSFLSTGRGVVTNNFHSSGVKVTFISKAYINKYRGAFNSELLSFGRLVRVGVCAALACGIAFMWTASRILRRPCWLAMAAAGLFPSMRGEVFANAAGDFDALDDPGNRMPTVPGSGRRSRCRCCHPPRAGNRQCPPPPRHHERRVFLHQLQLFMCWWAPLVLMRAPLVQRAMHAGGIRALVCLKMMTRLCHAIMFLDLSLGGWWMAHSLQAFGYQRPAFLFLCRHRTDGNFSRQISAEDSEHASTQIMSSSERADSMSNL